MPEQPLAEKREEGLQETLEQAREVVELWLGGLELDADMIRLDDLLARNGFKGSL